MVEQGGTVREAADECAGEEDPETGEAADFHNGEMENFLGGPVNGWRDRFAAHDFSTVNRRDTPQNDPRVTLCIPASQAVVQEFGAVCGYHQSLPAWATFRLLCRMHQIVLNEGLQMDVGSGRAGE